MTEDKSIKGMYRISTTEPSTSKHQSMKTKIALKAGMTPHHTIMGGSIGETGNEIKVSNERIDEESDARRSQGVSRMS